MVEFAILAPILVVLVLWSNFFWELQQARIKAAEAARFVAFERTVRPDVSRIASEAQDRYKDLDGSTKGVDLGSAYRNRLTVTVQAEDAPAPLSSESFSGISTKGGASGIAGAALGALGGTAEKVAEAMGLDTKKGAVKASIEFKVQNAIIPEQIALYTTGFSDDRLDVTFKENFYLFHDTWRAWGYGDSPANSYPRVEQITHDRARGVVYAGLASAGGGALSSIGDVLSVLGLDFPFQNSYIRDSVMIRPVGADGRYAATTPTRTVPGDQLRAAYWRDDDSYCYNNCEPPEIKQKRGFLNKGDYNDNWPMRTYNCRGKFFQGARQSNLPESEYVQSAGVGKSYFNYGGDKCAE
jgi:hypothetical protein